MQTHNSEPEKTIRPQNNGYPAGGTNKIESTPKINADPAQRGVIVAPPSGNTDDPNPMTVVQKGFDTLALAVKANIPKELFDYLDSEKELATNERRDVLVTYNGLQLHLKPHGGKGYYFIASGGPDGATWFFKKPNSNDPWGIRLSFGSYFMAMYGIGAAKAHTELALFKLGIRYAPEDISISRVDFCIDILAPHFELEPDNFIMHSAAGRRDYVTAEDTSIHGKSGRVTSVTVGNTRNRQVIMYDKRAEVIAHRKSHWWDIWNLTLYKVSKGEFDFSTLYSIYRDTRPPQTLTPDPRQAPANRIWRIEIRAGKDLLKDRWGIRTWEQLYSKFADLCREAVEVVRYTEPARNDPNRARWPNDPVWEIVCAEMNDFLMDMRSGADPNPMKEVHREQHVGTLSANILGTAIARAAMHQKSSAELPDYMIALGQDLSQAVRANPATASKKLQNAKDRYVFLKPPEGR